LNELGAAACGSDLAFRENPSSNGVTPQVESGSVYLPHPSIAPCVEDFIDAMAAFSNGRNDDQVDAMTAYRRLSIWLHDFFCCRISNDHKPVSNPGGMAPRRRDGGYTSMVGGLWLAKDLSKQKGRVTALPGES